MGSSMEGKIGIYTRQITTSLVLVENMLSGYYYWNQIIPRNPVNAQLLVENREFEN